LNQEVALSSLNEVSYFIEKKQYVSAISLVAALSRSVKQEYTYSELQKSLKAVPEEAWSEWCQRKANIVISTASTLRHLNKQFNFFFKLAQIQPNIQYCEYDIPGDCLNPSVEIKNFKPDFFVIHPTFENISNWPQLSLDGKDHDQSMMAETNQLMKLAQSAHEILGSKIILDLYSPYPYSAMGMGELKTFGAKKRFVSDVNEYMKKAHFNWLQLHDLEKLAEYVGIKNWYDERMWVQAKIEMTTTAAEAYIKTLAALVGSSLGLTKKCLVLDLDNTVWGGVIGDAGLNGIQIGLTSPEGQSFSTFQQYCLDLKKHGTLLAVASKNELEIAKEPFQQLTDMIIKENDVDVFKANWGPKSESLKQIAKELNIGVDSLIFFDDNPAERMEVMSHCPMVYVVDVPEEVSLYVKALDQTAAFQLPNPTKEDFVRAKQYQSERARSTLETSAVDFESFLKSLEMSAELTEFKSNDISRISQLINKTNQFNLTTRRYTEAECEAFMKNKDCIAFTVRLRDRFGDHGLISVVIAHIKNKVAIIDTWLMSCRVLKRGVEELVLSVLQDKLQAKGVEELRGEYIPTKKNMMVAELYPKYGFEPIKVEIMPENNGSLYRKYLPLDPPVHYITPKWES
jgi:FkbH-like protein